MLIPLLGPAPPYLPYFVTSAMRSAPLVDFLVFHEHLHLPWEQKQLPANVKVATRSAPTVGWAAPRSGSSIDAVGSDRRLAAPPRSDCSRRRAPVADSLSTLAAVGWRSWWV